MNKILLLGVIVLLVSVFVLITFLEVEIVENPNDWTDTSVQLKFKLNE